MENFKTRQVSNIEGDAEKVRAREARIAELEFSLHEARREIQRYGPPPIDLDCLVQRWQWQRRRLF